MRVLLSIQNMIPTAKAAVAEACDGAIRPILAQQAARARWLSGEQACGLVEA
jgi:hypothetical protein